MTAALLGWVGTAGTFIAYALLWKGHLTASSMRYASLNFVGGLLAGTASVLYGAWPSAASNFVWAALGLHSMLGEREPSEDVVDAPVLTGAGHQA